MKHIILLSFGLILCYSTTAQQTMPTPVIRLPGDFHVHQGFHFEFGIGPAFGTITDDIVDHGVRSTLEFSGTGLGIDLKLGGFVQENLLLSFDIITKAIPGPEVRSNGQVGSLPNDYTLSETMYGAGITYYIMPQDLFFSGTLGSGVFSLNDNNSNTTGRSEYGFAWQLKFGKHWWISSKWGIALAGTYGSTSATDSYSDGFNSTTEDFSSSRFAILVSIGLR